MKFEITPLISSESASVFTNQFSDILASFHGLTESKIQSYFVDKAVGAKSKSLASTVRTLVLNDLQLKGWTTNWSPFKGFGSYESAMWNFDAAKKIQEGWITLEISFDNRVAVGTHLVKSTVANNLEYRKFYGGDKIVHHCIIAASKSFKESSGLDNSVATSEEFEQAAKAYSVLGLTGITLISLSALETLEVLQRKSDGRTKSKILNIGPK